MAPKIFRITRRIVIFVMICWLGNILWKNHTTPHYDTPSAPAKVETAPAKVETAPTKVETVPAKVETAPTKVESKSTP